MQRKLILFLVGLFAATSAANAQIKENPYNGVPSNVTVFAKDGDKFWLILNGEKQNATPAANVKIGNLSSYNYKIKVIFENAKIPSLDANMYARDIDNNALNVVYEIKKNKKGNSMVMRLVSNEIIGKPNPSTMPDHHADAADYNKPQPANNQVVPTAGQVSMNIKVPGMDGQGGNVEVKGNGIHQQTDLTTGATTYTHQVNGNSTAISTPGMNSPAASNSPSSKPVPSSCKQAMADATFQNQLATVKKQSFSDTKLKTAKTVVSKNCLSTNQVTQLLKVIAYEKDKLELAKFAYPYTVDKENYLTISNVFSFSSSTSELTDFINSQ